MKTYFANHKHVSPESHLWRRVHRPEEYTEDLVRYIARDLGLPPALLMPVAPVGRRIAAGLPAAAVETTQFDVFACGRRRLRTVFQIANYSDRSVYQLVERMLKTVGIGRNMKADPDIDFTWLLLGGVLNDYAGRAHLHRDATDKLLAFRLRNSDYFTMTTWFPNCVEIANLTTGRVERIELPPEEIAKVVNYSVGVLKNIAGVKSRSLRPESPEMCEFHGFLETYENLCAKR
jgi:hypothetical protein